MAWMYYLGEGGVQRDPAQAAEWFHKAANRGNQGAKFYMALLYYVGEGLPQDQTKGAEWLGKAAEQGDARAEHLLQGRLKIGGLDRWDSFPIHR